MAGPLDLSQQGNVSILFSIIHQNPNVRGLNNGNTDDNVLTSDELSTFTNYIKDKQQTRGLSVSEKSFASALAQLLPDFDKIDIAGEKTGGGRDHKISVGETIAYESDRARN